MTSSKIWLAEACPGSHAYPHQAELVAAGVTGTHGHGFLERVLLGDLDGARELAPADLRNRLDGINLTRLRELFGAFTARVEEAFAYDPRTDRARSLGLQTGRDYSKATIDEITGTVDAWAGDEGWAVVADWKFGRSFVAHPRENRQIHLFAVAAARITTAPVVRGIIGRVEEDGGSRLYHEDFDVMALDAIAHQLGRIRDRVRAAQMSVEDGRRPELVLGEHCTYCPARWSCPAQADAGQQLVELASRAKELSPEAAGKAYVLASAVERAVKAMKSVLIERAKAEPLPLPNGKFLKVFPERLDVLDLGVALDIADDGADEVGEEFEAITRAASLSKEALERELGKDAAIAFIERLKAAKGIRDGQRLMPRQVAKP